MLAVIVAAVALQAGRAQATPVVSMKVTDPNGLTVGVACEPFDCVPHRLPINAGTTLLTEMHGLGNEPYILFAGPPAVQCFTLPWVLGAIAMDSPILIVGVGLVPAFGMPNECGLHTAVEKLPIPVGAPVGARLVLQTAAWPAVPDSPAFSRGVMLDVVLATY